MTDTIRLVLKFTHKDEGSALWYIEGWVEFAEGARRFKPYRACRVGTEEQLDAWTGFDDGEPEAWEEFAAQFVNDDDSTNPPEPWTGEALLAKVTPLALGHREALKALRFGFDKARSGLGPNFKEIVFLEPLEVPFLMECRVKDLREKLAADRENLRAAAERAAPAAQRAADFLQRSQIDFAAQARKVIEEMRERGEFPLKLQPVRLPAPEERRASDRALILRFLEEVEAADRKGRLRRFPMLNKLREFTAAVRRFVDGTRE